MPVVKAICLSGESRSRKLSKATAVTGSDARYGAVHTGRPSPSSSMTLISSETTRISSIPSPSTSSISTILSLPGASYLQNAADSVWELTVDTLEKSRTMIARPSTSVGKSDRDRTALHSHISVWRPKCVANPPFADYPAAEWLYGSPQALD